jgi:hypothetical protein
MSAKTSLLTHGINYVRKKFYVTGYSCKFLPGQVLSLCQMLMSLTQKPFALFNLFNRRHDTQHNDIQQNVTQHKEFI